MNKRFAAFIGIAVFAAAFIAWSLVDTGLLPEAPQKNKLADAMAKSIPAALPDQLDDAVRPTFSRANEPPSKEAVFLSGGLPRIHNTSPQFMELALPDDRSMRVLFSEHTVSSSGAVNWTGRIDGEPESFFSLSVAGDAVAGHTLSEQGEFELLGTLSGKLELNEMNLPDGFCQTCQAVHDRTGAFGGAFTERTEEPAVTASAAGDPVIDVLVVYTPLALADAGSLDALLAKANQMINSLNSISSNSDAGMTANLMGIAPVSHPAAGAASDGSVSALYSRLINANDGQLDEAHDYRAAYGADMVCVFGKATGYGIASIGGAWSAADYFTAHGVMPHELGHNLGCGHNDSGSGQTNLQGVYGYSYGHYFNVDGELRGTLMSYIGRRSTRFSNPGRSWNGVVTGTAARDHARTIRTFAPTAAGWKTSNPSDYDNDGIPNSEESGSADADGDGLPDMLDPDNLPPIPEPTRGLAAHWPLDEGAGTVTADAAGFGYNGELLNGAAWGSDAERGTYAVFDGTDDRILTPFTYALADTNDFTWAWWAKKDPTSHSGSIMVGNRYPERASPRFGFIKMTPAGAQFANTATAGEIDKYNYEHILQNGWHHYAMVKSGTSYQWYVDGAAQGASTNLNYSEGAPIPFVIGGDDNDTIPGGKENEHFHGFIDDVLLYREALTPEEVVDVKNGNYPYAPLHYELIAGWDTWSSSTAPGASYTAVNVTASATASAVGGTASWAINDSADDPGRGSSDDTTWGTYDGGVSPASIVTTNGPANFTLTNGKTDGEITFTINNAGTEDIILDQFHFDAVAFRGNAARTYALNVLAGSDVTVGTVFISSNDAITDLGGALTGHDQHDDIDIDLSGLADNVLEAGGTAIIQLAFSSGTGSGGGHHLFVDNVGITGAFLPLMEPPEAPVLVHEISGSDMVFSWTGSGFKVQSRTNLTEGIWQDIPGGGAPPVTNSAADTEVFFRLIEQ